MRQDSRPVLKIHTPRDEPQGFSRLRRVASAAKETEPELAEWLEQAVTNLESGTNPKAAFSLARKRGRPTTSNRDGWKQIVVGAHVNRLRDDGLSYEKAVGQVADELHLSDSSVKRYFTKYRHFEKYLPFRQFQDAVGEFFQRMGELRQVVASSGLMKFLCDLDKTLAGVAEQLGRSELGRALNNYVAIVRGQTGKK